MVAQLDIFNSAPPKILDGEQAVKIILSAIASKVIVPSKELIQSLASNPESKNIARSLNTPQLIRQLNLVRGGGDDELLKVEKSGNIITHNGVDIGRIALLYKSPLPGELQAKLAIESAIDRFLEYLAKVHYIIVLDESDRHVRIFSPISVNRTIEELWRSFIDDVAFSDYGKHQLPGLVQTFILMLNTIVLAGRGFSTLDIPIINRKQADILAAWYRAVIRDVEGRQNKRQWQIDELQQSIDSDDLNDKERTSKEKEIKDKQDMQAKEEKKYHESFQKSFIDGLNEQKSIWESIDSIEQQLKQENLTKPQLKKLQKEEEKLKSKIVFSQDSVKCKLATIEMSGDNPFAFVSLTEQESPETFDRINSLAKTFTKTASDQINSTRGDIFTQCLWEMYRISEMNDDEFDPIPSSLITEKPVFNSTRSPGDDSREFCYACGVKIDDKRQWQVLRFIFERPSQRRQSSPTEARPHICRSCAVLAFASPLKVTDDSIILRLESKGDRAISQGKIKDYLRMLTNKELHLNAGKYIVLSSDKSSDGKSASEKLGKVQYALAKVASILPLEVLNDFKVLLVIQGSEILLPSHHLMMIKGLMDCYKQSIAAKEINLKLGDAIRYVQEDLPYLADYTLACISDYQTDIALEQVRQRYWQNLNILIKEQGNDMNSNTQGSKRARLYRDVAALTGITFAFAQSLESTAKNLMKPEDAEREVSKLIEKVDDAIAFNYYATLGDEKKTSVQARLYLNPDLQFIYSQSKDLLKELEIEGREQKDDRGTSYLQFYSDDTIRVYQHFANGNYAQERDWKELTYNLKLSLYTRFPELVRKLKSTGDK